MDHAHAVQANIGDKYLLGELTASQEDEFAEHFFDCEECANDLRMSSLFLETTKKVLAEDRGKAATQKAQRRGAGWPSVRYAIAASVALFAFTLYQNTVTIPALRQASAPQALDFFSMASLGSRGDGQTAITPVGGRPFVLVIDIPPQTEASEYRAQILTEAGTTVLAINISETAAKKTVPLLIPGSALKKGSYWLALSSRPNDKAAFTEFEKHSFQVL